MFWIHGGAWISGKTDGFYKRPDLMIEEDVIVVTFNYRLGPLGIFCGICILCLNPQLGIFRFFINVYNGFAWKYRIKGSNNGITMGERKY